MNEKKLSLAEAIAEIERAAAQEDAKPEWDRDAGYVDGLNSALQTVRRVDPDEELQAVLWLMKENGWEMHWISGKWQQVTVRQGGRFYVSVNPIEEAKKLRWKS